MSAIRSAFPHDPDRAVMVARHESGLRAEAHNGNAKTGDDSWGLFQINRFGSLAKSRPPVEDLVDPLYNISYAAAMQKRQGWCPAWGAARRLGYCNK